MTARRAVLADVSVPALYGGLVAPADLPDQVLTDVRRFQWDFATFKADWALDGPVPWRWAAATGAGTVHLADGLGELTRFTAQITMGQVSDRPFCLSGQMTTSDPSRSPHGTAAAGPAPVPPRAAPTGGRGSLGRTGPLGAGGLADRAEGGTGA